VRLAAPNGFRHWCRWKKRHRSVREQAASWPGSAIRAPRSSGPAFRSIRLPGD